MVVSKEDVSLVGRFIHPVCGGGVPLTQSVQGRFANGKMQWQHILPFDAICQSSSHPFTNM